MQLSPVKEGFAAEHGRELVGNALEHFLNGGGVSYEGDGHLQSLWWNIAYTGLHVVRNPLNEVRGVLVLHIEHLLIYLLGAHAAAEESTSREVTAVSGVGGAHHIFCVEHLLRQLGDGKRTVLLRAAAGQRSEANQEEMQTREGNQVHRQFPEVRVQLARET